MILGFGLAGCVADGVADLTWGRAADDELTAVPCGRGFIGGGPPGRAFAFIGGPIGTRRGLLACPVDIFSVAAFIFIPFVTIIVDLLLAGLLSLNKLLNCSQRRVATAADHVRFEHDTTNAEPPPAFQTGP